jgi:hypothetical protein
MDARITSAHDEKEIIQTKMAWPATRHATKLVMKGPGD